MQVDRTRVYRVKTVAELLDVSVATIYRAADSGTLRTLKIGTGTGALRIPGDALADYLAGCEQATISPGRLTEAQADGRECVICGLDFMADCVAHYPVGRSLTGSQVFACTTHRDEPSIAAGDEFAEVA